MEENKEKIEVQLYSSTNEYEINQICVMLKENNIPFIKKFDGSGAYMNIYMGQSIQEKRIFVRKEDYDKSLEIISVFIHNDIEKEEEQEEIDNSSNRHTLIRRCFGLFILGMPILIIIVLIISLLINN